MRPCDICFIFMYLFEPSHKNVMQNHYKSVFWLCREIISCSFCWTQLKGHGGRHSLSSEMIVYGHYSPYFCNTGVFDCGVCMQLMLCYTLTPVVSVQVYVTAGVSLSVGKIA